MFLEFYEKPGCGGNARQKAKLQAAGCTLAVKDLLKTKFDPRELLSFFGQKPVSEWFNLSAPQIKESSVNPQNISKDEAIEMMIKEPILIKRPLIKKGDIKISGFDPLEIKEKLGLDVGEAPESCNENDKCRQN